MVASDLPVLLERLATARLVTPVGDVAACAETVGHLLAHPGRLAPKRTIFGWPRRVASRGPIMLASSSGGVLPPGREPERIDSFS